MAVPLIGPDGREYEIEDPAKVEQAVALGYRVATAEAPRTLGEQVKAGALEATDTLEAGVEGLVQGASASGYGAWLGRGKDDSETPEQHARRRAEADEMFTRKAEHPVAAGVGEFAGMVASPINKLGAAVRGGIGATTAIGRIGAAALGGGAEGLLYGAGNTMSEAALGNTDLTAEKLVSGAGLGALLGFGGAGIGTGIAEGWKAAAPAVGRAIAGTKGPIEEFAENRWLKAGGATTKGYIKGIPELERPAVANIIRESMSPTGKVLPASLEDAAMAVSTERDTVAKQLMKEIGVGEAGGLVSKMDKDEALEALARGFKENGDRMGAVLSKADEMGAAPQFSGALKRFDDLEAALNPAERDIVAGDLARARKYILEIGSAPAASQKNSFKAMNSLKSTLQDDINWADSGAKNNLKKKLVGIIRDELDTQFEVQMGPTLGAEFQSAKAAYGALKNAAKSLKGKNATGADAIRALVKDAELTSPSLAGKLSALDHASKILKHGTDQRIGGRFTTLSDYLAGMGAGALSGGPLGALLGFASAMGHKVLREQGPAIIAKLADGIAKSPRLMVAASSFGQKLQGAAPNLGKYAAPLLQALAHSPAEALATHMTMARADDDYAEAAKVAGFLPETPEEDTHAQAKGSALAGMSHQMEAQNSEIAKGIEAMLSGKRKPHSPTTVMGSQDFGAKRMRAKDSLTAHNKRVEEIRGLASNPEALLERVSGNTSDVAGMAPGVVASMTRTAYAAVQYLAKESQVPPKGGPLASAWHATEAEQFEFAQKLEAVQDPMSVLKHAAAGTLVESQWQAVQAVYPLLAAQIRDTTLERLSESPKDVPYRTRMMLGIIAGIDPDGSFGTGVAINQGAIAAAAEAPRDEMGAGAPKESKVTLGSRSATTGQRLENKNNEATV